MEEKKPIELTEEELTAIAGGAEVTRRCPYCGTTITFSTNAQLMAHLEKCEVSPFYKNK